MSRLVKFLMIILVIFSFSSGLVNLLAMFVSLHPQNNLMLAIFSLILCRMMNQDIIMDEEDKINELDETF